MRPIEPTRLPERASIGSAALIGLGFLVLFAMMAERFGFARSSPLLFAIIPVGAMFWLVIWLAVRARRKRERAIAEYDALMSRLSRIDDDAA